MRYKKMGWTVFALNENDDCGTLNPAMITLYYIDENLQVPITLAINSWKPGNVKNEAYLATPENDFTFTLDRTACWLRSISVEPSKYTQTIVKYAQYFGRVNSTSPKTIGVALEYIRDVEGSLDNYVVEPYIYRLVRRPTDEFGWHVEVTHTSWCHPGQTLEVDFYKSTDSYPADEQVVIDNFIQQDLNGANTYTAFKVVGNIQVDPIIEYGSDSNACYPLVTIPLH